MQTIAALVNMAGDCTYNPRYGNAETFSPSPRGGADPPAGGLRGRGPPPPHSPNFEVIDGLLYRKKLERGFINYREVLSEDRRHEAISTFHRRRPGLRHLTFEETYRSVADNYWWDGMYFHIRSLVIGCPECQHTQKPERGGASVTMTMESHADEVLRRLRGQREAGLFCDITLRTQGRAFTAHRAVLAAVSEYFQEILAEEDVNAEADVDLTGFSEHSLLSLLDFSYSSTLRVQEEDLQEVSAMARHLGMWPALDACAALLRGQQPPPAPPSDGLRPPRRRERFSSRAEENLTEDSLSPAPSPSPRRGAERTDPRLRPPGTPPQNGALHSPTHTRMKLMDFKSPSCKKAQASRPLPHSSRPLPQASRPLPQASRPAPATPPRPKSSPLHSPHSRLLRSTPGAAQEVLRLLPRPESPRRNKKRPPAPPRPDRGPPRRPGFSPTRRPRLSASRLKQEAAGAPEDEQDCERAQEKYRLMRVLGLQRTALLPRPEDLVGWRQKKRLRKLKANDYSLTKRRPPRAPEPPARLLQRAVKEEPEDRPASRRAPPSDRSMRSGGSAPGVLCGGRELRSSPRRAAGALVRTPPPVAALRAPPPMAALRAPPPVAALRAPPPVAAFRTIKAEPMDFFISAPPLPQGHRGDGDHAARGDIGTTAPHYNGRRPPSRAKLPHAAATATRPPARREGGRQAPKVVHEGGTPPGPPAASEASFPSGAPPSAFSHPLYRVIKEEPADPLPVATPFPDPPSPDLGKRRSKPPIKLLDPGFLFSFCRPAGVKEESVDICLTRSVSRGQFAAAAGAQPRVLRPRGGLAAPPQTRVKRERVEHAVSRRPHRSTRPSRTGETRGTAHRAVRPRPTQDTPKTPGRALPSRRCVLKPPPRAPGAPRLKDPRVSHRCLQCHTSYRDCLALVMHRLRHVGGKHWPCPLCSKNFFRLRNVRNHIRTHDQKLYKCRGCLTTS